jgi:integrase
MTVSPTPALLDIAGRRRSPATLPGYHAGRPPRTKGQRYPADPPSVEEIIAVMRAAGEDRHGARLRALIAVLWRAGLRIQEVLALSERDLDPERGALLVRSGKGGRRREIGMDAWGFEQLRPWLEFRLELPVGPLFCVIDGPTRGHAWSAAGVRVELRRLARAVGVRRRLPRTSFGTSTRSSSRARAWRSTSSSASSGTRTSARPRSTCRGSTPRRSSPRSTGGTGR